ncbi:hypothetical protein ABIE67_002505 [Streptomyces sp. V4I8]
MAADTGADRPVHGEPGGDQRAQPEQAQHLSEQPGVALCLGSALLPGGDLADRAGAQHGHGALDGVVRVVGVRQAQPDHLAAGVAYGGRRSPDETRLLARPVPRLGAVGYAEDGQAPVGAGQGEGVAGGGQEGAGQTGLQDHAVGVRGVQPVAGGEQWAAHCGALGSAAQFDGGAGSAGGESGGSGRVGACDRLDAVEVGQLPGVGRGTGVQPYVCAVRLGEDALPGVGGVAEECRGQQQGDDDPGGGEHEEQGLAAVRAQIGVRPAQGGSHLSP